MSAPAVAQWLGDEAMMKVFVERGGGSFDDVKERRADIELICLSASGDDIGYIYVEANMFAEGPLWVFTSRGRDWMPFPIEPSDGFRVFSRDGKMLLEASAVEFNCIENLVELLRNGLFQLIGDTAVADVGE